MLSILLGRNISDIQLPMVVLSASGWHSDLYLIDNYQTLLSNNNTVDRVWPYLITKLWWTRDDAAGEALIRLQDCYDDHTLLVVNEYERKQIYGVYIVIMKIKNYQSAKLKYYWNR